MLLCRLLLLNFLVHWCCYAEVFILTQMLLCRSVGKYLKHLYYGAEVLYLDFSSGMENRTLSQICGRLHLPMFLLGGRVDDSDVNGFFDGSGHAMTLPSYNLEVFHWCCAVQRAFGSKYSIYKLATMGLTGKPIAVPLTCS